MQPDRREFLKSGLAAGVSGHGDGTTVLGNHIHDIACLPPYLENHGIYADSGASNWRIGFNWIHDITGGNLIQFFERVLRTAERAVIETTSQLPILQSAGVVDAGAQGYRVIIEAFLVTARGDSICFRSDGRLQRLVIGQDEPVDISAENAAACAVAPIGIPAEDKLEGFGTSGPAWLRCLTTLGLATRLWSLELIAQGGSRHTKSLAVMDGFDGVQMRIIRGNGCGGADAPACDARSSAVHGLGAGIRGADTGCIRRGVERFGLQHGLSPLFARMATYCHCGYSVTFMDNMLSIGSLEWEPRRIRSPARR